MLYLADMASHVSTGRFKLVYPPAWPLHVKAVFSRETRTALLKAAVRRR